MEKLSSEFFKISDYSEILTEFFKNFDQILFSGKLYWQIHQMTLEFLRISIRILVENAAVANPSDDCKIPFEFVVFCFVSLYRRVLIRILVGKF